MDSHANLCGAAKDRIGSSRMRHVMLRTNAVLVAGRLRDVNGYTRSDINPADAPSRDLKAWAAHRAQHSSAPHRARGTQSQLGGKPRRPADRISRVMKTPKGDKRRRGPL